MSITVKAMRYFTAALRHGNISRAAEELHVAASAVSAAIDQIEGHFQLTLVHRHRARGIQATASGKALEARFLALLDDYDAVLRDGAELKQALRGRLRIGYYAPVAPAFLPEILRELLGPERQVELHLEECDNTQAQTGLLEGAYDAILFVSDAALPQISFAPLVKAPPYCLLAADHKLSAQKRIHLEDLISEQLIVLNRPLAVEYYREMFELAGRAPARAIHVNSTEMVRSLVGAGHGCAILNMLPATDVSYAGNQLIARPLADELPALTLSIGYDTRSPRRLVQHVVDRARDYFANPEHLSCIVS